MAVVKLPYRIVEVLAALVRHPDGLSHKAIYDSTRLIVGTEVSNEKAVTNIIYSIRNGTPPLVKTLTTAHGTIHKITADGCRRLYESIDIDTAALLDIYAWHIAYRYPTTEAPKPYDTQRQKPAAILDHRQEPAVENLSQLDETENQQPDDSAVAKSQDAAIEMEQPETAGPFQDQTLSTDSALETLARDGYLFLDPNDEIESALITMAHYMRSARELQSAPVIADKALKIHTLCRLANMMSEDICQVLETIVDDLEKLEAA